MTQSIENRSNDTRFLARIAQEFHPQRLVPSLTGGLIVGLIEVALAISFAALIFAGDLLSHVSNGIGLALFGAIVGSIAVALFCSLPGTVGGNQDAPAAILAVISAAIVSTMPAGSSSQETFLTVVAAIALTTLLTGTFFLALGYLKLGGLVRFLPYPVVGGFLAGTGWLLVTGAISMMAEIPLSISGLPALLQPEMLVRWLPGLILAIVMLLISNRSDHYLGMPGMILGAIILFYAIVWLSGSSVSELSAEGWFLGPFPKESLWQPLNATDLANVNWSVIWGQAANAATILIVSVVALLLNASGLELTTEHDIELNRELRAAGVGNLVAGLGAGLVGYQQLSLSALNHKLGAFSRLAGLIAAGVCGLALLLGASVLSLFPTVVVGGLLLFLGLAFLYEWVYQTWFTFPKIDYFIILLILFVIAAVGFLEGVAVGIVAAIIMFVVNYSGVDVVKHELSGTTYQSRVTRSGRQRQILREQGDQLYLVQLQGFIFFGTANSLLEKVRQRVHQLELPPVRFVILDFRQVTGFDSTAMLSFAKIKQLAQSQDFTLVITHPSREIRRQLDTNGLVDEEGGVVRIFPDLDYGLEWYETEILLAAGAQPDEEHRTLKEQLEELLNSTVDVTSLLKYLERQRVDAGHHLMKQGDPPDDLYFIESGQVTARLELPGQDPIRLETMKGGRVVGEIGFYLGHTRTAAVVADEPSTVYRLTASALKEMEKNNPEAASLFHQIIVDLLAERVTHLINVVNALQR
jgi:SulP family sulfate permease